MANSTRAKKIAPSILSADFANLAREVASVAKHGADWIHVDVMDGHFVPNITIGVPVVASLKKISSLPLDVHLMIENPEKYVPEFVKAGADWLTIHVESTKNPADLLKKIRSLGCKSGITLRPKTALADILPLLDYADLALVMTVEPGFGGQVFMRDQVVKIETLRTEISKRGLTTLIEVDGGVNQQTKDFCSQADVLVAGHAIFRASDYGTAIRNLRS